MPNPLALAMAGSAVAGGISGYAQSRINSRTARRNTDLTNQANKDMAELAHQRDLEMWNRQNDYNNPSAQMQRMKNAGLNPHLMYGQGNVGNASSMPSYNAPSQDYNYLPPHNLAETLQQASNIALGTAQINNIEATTQKTKAETANTLISGGLIQSESDIKRLQAAFAPELMETQLGAAKSGLKSINADVILKGIQSEIAQIEADYNKKGISLKDPLQWRMLDKFLQENGISNLQIMEFLSQYPNVKRAYDFATSGKKLKKSTQKGGK